jgi:hypothetical protein
MENHRQPKHIYGSINELNIEHPESGYLLHLDRNGIHISNGSDGAGMRLDNEEILCIYHQIAMWFGLKGE